MTWILIWKAIKAFLGKNWLNIALIIGIVVGIFFLRAQIIRKIELHDRAIVKATEARKDSEWQAKLDRQRHELLEDLANVKKNSKDLERNRPHNQSDTIKLLRGHRLNTPN